MSQPGNSRFRTAQAASLVVRIVAVLVIAGGIETAVAVHRRQSLSQHQRAEAVAASLASAVVVASFLAVFAYLIPLLVAIYDEVRH